MYQAYISFNSYRFLTFIIDISVQAKKIGTLAKYPFFMFPHQSLLVVKLANYEIMGSHLIAKVVRY